MTFAKDIKTFFVRKIKICFQRTPEIDNLEMDFHNQKSTTRTAVESKEELISYSAIFSIIVSFYQIKSLIEVKTGEGAGVAKFIDNILNIQLFTYKGFDSFCPTQHLTAISKEVFSKYGTSFVMQ